MPRIAVLGDLIMDIHAGPLNFFPKKNECSNSESINLKIGGSAANTARYLGSLGLDTRIFSALGDDYFSKIHLNNLKKEKLVKYENSITFIKGCNSPSVVALFDKNDTSFIINYGTLKKFYVEDINIPLLMKSTHFHIGGYFGCVLLLLYLFLEKLQSNELTELIKKTKTNGMTISLNTQSDSKKQWTGLNQNLKQILPLIDVFFPNLHEAMQISKTDTIEKAFDYFSNLMKNSIIVITCGSKGAYFRVPQCYNDQNDQNSFFHVKACKVNEIDSTGAGDAFIAGFLSKWLVFEKNLSSNGIRFKFKFKEMFERNFVENAVEYGCFVSSKSVMKMGGFVEIEM